MATTPFDTDSSYVPGSPWPPLPAGGNLTTLVRRLRAIDAEILGHVTARSGSISGPFTISGLLTLNDDLKANWDGTSPANLATADGTATKGLYVDGSVGSMQIATNLWIGGDIRSKGFDGSGIPDAAASAGFALEGSTGDFQFLGTGRIDGALTIGGAVSLASNLTMSSAGLIRSAASGERVEIGGSASHVDRIRWFSGIGNEDTEGQINVGASGSGITLTINGPIDTTETLGFNQITFASKAASSGGISITSIKDDIRLEGRVGGIKSSSLGPTLRSIDGNVGTSVDLVSDQAITGGTWTFMAWDAETVDDNVWHSTTVNNERITVDIAGWYIITATVRWTAIAANERAMTRILLNQGSPGAAAPTEVCRVDQALAAGTNLTQNVVGVAKLAVSDHIEVAVWVTNAASVEADDSNFTVARLF